MAELDYAFLADFASVQGGKLTAVGASFTHLRAHKLPAARPFALAGRIRTEPGAGPTELEIAVRGPDGSFEMSFMGEIEAGPETRPYGPEGEQRVGLLFAMNIQLPLPAAGLYTFEISIEGKPVRRLAFDVEER